MVARAKSGLKHSYDNAIWRWRSVSMVARAKSGLKLLQHLAQRASFNCVSMVARAKSGLKQQSKLAKMLLALGSQWLPALSRD